MNKFQLRDQVIDTLNQKRFELTRERESLHRTREQLKNDVEIYLRKSKKFERRRWLINHFPIFFSERTKIQNALEGTTLFCEEQVLIERLETICVRYQNHQKKSSDYLIFSRRQMAKLKRVNTPSTKIFPVKDEIYSRTSSSNDIII